MNNPESFIITLRCAERGIEIDLELPSSLIIKELRGKILDILKNLYPEDFETWLECEILHNCIALMDSETLLSSGIFDGQYIEVVKI
ncbi:MAG: hypothetical protein IJ576_03665 [Synergistaceae bacterium]|nr:hypothetical protein [Synergistaceae bacterium]MBR1603409.1 hypothetical protein [Synergistaceae bacterium]